MGWSFYNSSGQLLTAPASTASADLATVATTVTITDNESTDENNVIVFVAGADADGGNVGLESDGTLHYNPSTGKVTATSFAGNLSGNVTGNTSGTAGSATGNAATATALQTARNIGGVSFDGTGNITLPGVNSSGNQNTSGNAATVTTNANLTGNVTSSGNDTTLVLSDLTGAVINVAADSIPFLDADGSATRIESIADLATAMAGTNLTASSGQLVAGAAGAGLGLVIALS